MKNCKKWICLLLVAAIMMSAAACGKSDGNTKNNQNNNTGDKNNSSDQATSGQEAPDSAIDTSERVDLVFYVMGDAPKDELKVEDAINKILLKKLNATVDFQFATWTDWSQKYNLELTSGSADLIYVANWNNYQTLANSGAFLELDDMLATYAPDILNTVSSSLLDQCKVSGKLYAIPATWAEYTSPGIMYREDVREKYNLPVPDSLENVEAFLLGVKENDPQQGLLNCTTNDSTGLQVAFDGAQALNLKYSWVITNGLPYGLTADYDTPSDIYDYWFSDDFVTDMKLMKKWADLGFWTRSALSDANDADIYKNGFCVMKVGGQNPNKDIDAVNSFAENHPDWKSEYLAYGEVNGAIYPGHATQNATAVVRGSKNAQRALMVLNLMLCDKEVNDLVEYGIEGTHYSIDTEGIYQNLSKDFPYEGFNTWALRNGDYKLPQKTDVLLKQMFSRYEEIGNKTKFPNINIYGGFSEDYNEYQVERSAVSDVMRQYLAPLQAGLVKDVEISVEEFRNKVKEAGLDICREAFEKQWQIYCEEHGYK